MSNQQYSDHQFQSDSDRNHSSISDSQQQHHSSHISNDTHAQQENIQFELHTQALLQQLSQRENHSTFQVKVMSDIEYKLQSFKQAAKLPSTTDEELVNLRIQQLVLNKLLVFTYFKSQFRLVIAHYNLGQAYLRYQCHQQAIQHIGLALDKLLKQFLNPNITNQQKANFLLVQSYMHNFYAKAHMLMDQYDEAIEILKEALEIYQKNQRLVNIDKQQLWKVQTLILLAQSYSKTKFYQQSINQISEAIEILDGNDNKRQTLALVFVERAKVESLRQNYSEALKAQEEAIEILIEVNYSKPQEVAEMYLTLSIYQEKIKNYQQAIKATQKSIKLYEQLYEPENKYVVKGRRRIAALLLKKQSYKQAIKQLLEIAQLQEKIFGENSPQLGRTYKLLGTVYLMLNETNNDARIYLRKAFTIFNTNGNKKLANWIKSKIRLIDNNGHLEGNRMKIIYEQQP